MGGPTPSIQEAIVAELRSDPSPRTSRDLAERFLRITHGDEETCRRLLAPLLEGAPGVGHRSGRGWSFEAQRQRIRAGVKRLDEFSVLATDGAGPGGRGGLRVACLLPVHAGEIGHEQLFPSWSGGIQDGSVYGVDPSIAVPRGEPRPGLTIDDLQRLIAAIGDRLLICHRVTREIEPLRRACVIAGLAFHPRMISAAHLGFLLLGLKRTHVALDLAGALGIETRGPDDCRGRARIVAEAWLRLLPRLRARGLTTPERVMEFQQRPAAPLNLASFAFSEEDLRDLPAAPGVYRFLDGRGRVIYVGKTKNLRSRVGSYFQPSARRTARVRAILRRLRSFEAQTVASDLEAELVEASLIAEHHPPLNRQFEIHERPAPYGPRLNLIVLLPDVLPGPDGNRTCTLHLLRGGRYLGRFPGMTPGAMPRPGQGGRRRDLVERLRRGYFGGGAGTGEASAGRDRVDVDWELIASYVRRHRDRVNVLDIDECASLDDALIRLRVLADAAASAPQPVIARGTAGDRD